MKQFKCDNCHAQGEAMYPKVPRGWTQRAYWLGDGNLVIQCCSEACFLSWEHNHVFR